MFCPNCGKEQVGNPKFCSSCGTKLVQESVIESDIEPEIKPSVEPRINQGIPPKSSSAALKWGAGLLLALAVYMLVIGILMVVAFLMGSTPGISLIGNFLWFTLTLIAGINALRKKHWGYVRGVAIWLIIIMIINLILSFVMGEEAMMYPAEAIVVLLIVIVCNILISKAKADFS